MQICAAVFCGLLGGAGVAQAMGYERVYTGPCADLGCIVATGSIGPGSAEDFAALLKEWKPQAGTPVILDSDGGDVVGAIKLGGVIRRAGLDTIVGAYQAGEAAIRPATCASACSYAFLGGLRRTLAAGGRFGVHQVYTFDSGALSAEDAQWLNALIAVHLNKMGASFGLLTLAMSTPPARMRWLTAVELASLGIVTRDGVSTANNGPAPQAAATLASVEREVGRQAPRLGAALGLGR